MIGADLYVGMKVTWMKQERGGYGYVTPVAGVVEKIGPKRVTITVQRINYLQLGPSQLVSKRVHPDSLTTRSNVVRGLDAVETATTQPRRSE